MDHYGIPRQVDSQVWWSDQPPNCPLMMVMMMPCMILAMVAGIDLRVLRAFPILDSPCWNNFGNPFSCESLITITSEGCERSASGNLLRHFAECRDGSTSIAPSWQVRHYNGPEWKDLKDLGILVMLQLWQNVGCFHLNIWYNRNRIWSKRICRKSTVSWDYVSEKHVGFVWNIETWGLRFFAALLEYHNLNFGSLIPFAGMEVTYNSPNRCRIAAKLWHFQSLRSEVAVPSLFQIEHLTNFGTRSSIATFPSWFPIAGGRVPHQDQQVDSNEPHGHLTADGVQFFKSSFPTWKIVGACDCARVGQLRISPQKAPLRDFSCGLKWLFRWKFCKSKENGDGNDGIGSQISVGFTISIPNSTNFETDHPMADQGRNYLDQSCCTVLHPVSILPGFLPRVCPLVMSNLFLCGMEVLPKHIGRFRSNHIHLPRNWVRQGGCQGCL